MLRLALRWKILLYASALLVILIAATLVYVNRQAADFVDSRISVEPEQAQRIESAERERLEDLKLTAQLVASFPALKAMLATDQATVQDFLTSYQQENRNASLLIALDEHGRVVARTDLPEAAPILDAEARWAKPALENRAATGILAASTGIYNAAAVPAEAGGTVFGFVVAGAPIDYAFARSLQDVTQSEVAILADRVLGSTLAPAKLPWHSADAWRSAVGPGGGRATVRIDNENYVAVTLPLGPQGEARPLAIILQSRDRALAPYRRIQLGLVILGLVVTLAGVMGSALLARTVTAPVAKLVEGTREVAAGNFEFRIDVRSGDEIGGLADSFNSMIQGLRERRDMQKFVSQSTVDMIQARLLKEGAVGERKLLTIFFSDMRGFTAMSEQMAPEEVVKILNACLGLQTEQVKKFDGDVDKFVGDCVVALFPGDDGALRAIRCATEIHRALEEYNAARPAGPRIDVGIGVVTGEVVLGSIGSRDRLDFTVIGSNVNLCARLCALAGPGEILIPESTYELVRDSITADRLEPQHVKGFSHAVPVYRVTGL